MKQTLPLKKIDFSLTQDEFLIIKHALTELYWLVNNDQLAEINEDNKDEYLVHIHNLRKKIDGANG